MSPIRSTALAFLRFIRFFLPCIPYTICNNTCAKPPTVCTWSRSKASRASARTDSHPVCSLLLLPRASVSSLLRTCYSTAVRAVAAVCALSSREYVQFTSNHNSRYSMVSTLAAISVSTFRARLRCLPSSSAPLFLYNPTYKHNIHEVASSHVSQNRCLTRLPPPRLHPHSIPDLPAASPRSMHFSTLQPLVLSLLLLLSISNASSSPPRASGRRFTNIAPRPSAGDLRKYRRTPSHSKEPWLAKLRASLKNPLPRNDTPNFPWWTSGQPGVAVGDFNGGNVAWQVPPALRSIPARCTICTADTCFSVFLFLNLVISICAHSRFLL